MTGLRFESKTAIVVLLASLAVTASRCVYGQQAGSGHSGPTSAKIDVSSKPWLPAESLSPDFIGIGWGTLGAGFYIVTEGPCPGAFWWGYCVCLDECYPLACIPIGYLIAPPPVKLLPVGQQAIVWGVAQTTTVSGDVEILMQLTRNGKVIETIAQGTVTMPPNSESLLSAQFTVPNNQGAVELQMTATVGSVTTKSSLPLTIQ